MWDVILELLDKIFDVVSFWPDKPTFQNVRNPFLVGLGCLFRILGILCFLISIIALLFYLL